MKIKTILLIVFSLTFCKVHGQAIEDTTHYNYAILYNAEGWAFQSTKLEVHFSTNKYLDLIKLLKINSDSTTNYQVIFKGLTFMEGLGYELVSSNSYSPAHAGTFREYVFRKKKK